MSQARMERRLEAILFADVVGYSRLMGIDEAGTLQGLQVKGERGRNEADAPGDRAGGNPLGTLFDQQSIDRQAV